MLIVFVMLEFETFQRSVGNRESQKIETKISHAPRIIYIISVDVQCPPGNSPHCTLVEMSVREPKTTAPPPKNRRPLLVKNDNSLTASMSRTAS